MLQRARLKLAASRAPLVLALFGTAAGVLSGLTIAAFRLLIEVPAARFMPQGAAENFEALPAWQRAALPIAGALVLAILYAGIGRDARKVGLVHVMQRLQFHEGVLPLKNLAVQFFAGAISQLAGHSVGRESPSIHLGAGVSSRLAQAVSLPSNAIRTLVACGTAAGIAASFNTPLAGVVFAMEVVMMEYTTAGFAPVILAAVAATAVTHAIFGDAHVFTVPPFGLVTLWELGMITLLGVACGALAAAFSQLTRGANRILKRSSVFARFGFAGAVCAAASLIAPEVLGLGYDTINRTILGEYAAPALAVVVLAKLLAPAAAVGAGLPGGLIGPALLMGACAGGAGAQVLEPVVGIQSSTGLFAMLGMGAMMSAVLQAPMAALLAILELTGNPNLIMPAMLAVIAANLTYKEALDRDSVIVQLLGDEGYSLSEHPLAKSLARVGVTAVMEPNVASLPQRVESQHLAEVMRGTPAWLSVSNEAHQFILPAVDVARFIEAHPDTKEVDLAEVPAQRLAAVDVRMQSTLLTAHDLLLKTGAGAVRVLHRHGRVPGSARVLGVVLPRDIETHYTYRPATLPGGRSD